jgi:hypothetical protein
MVREVESLVLGLREVGSGALAWLVLVLRGIESGVLGRLLFEILALLS